MWKDMPDSPGWWWLYPADSQLPVVVVVDKYADGWSLWMVGSEWEYPLKEGIGRWLKLEEPASPE